LNLEEGREIRK